MHMEKVMINQTNGGQEMHSIIQLILEQRVFAVVGASRNIEKYGYKVYKALLAAGFTVYPVNPNADEIDGNQVYPTLESVPKQINCVVTVVPPNLTLDIMRQAGALNIPYVWMQPGSEGETAVMEAETYGMDVVHSGPCIMVAVLTKKNEASAESGR